MAFHEPWRYVNYICSVCKLLFFQEADLYILDTNIWKKFMKVSAEYLHTKYLNTYL